MNLNSLFPGLLWLCMPLVRSESLTGSKLLVVLEDAELKSSFSQFFEDLEKRGYELDIQSPKNEGLELLRYGEKSYSHVILFPPKSKGQCLLSRLDGLSCVFLQHLS
jgi:oligosaccharyltransferase complex subunit beta